MESNNDLESLISWPVLSFSLSELPTEEILMPWEQGVWKDLFKPNSAITELHCFSDDRSLE